MRLVLVALLSVAFGVVAAWLSAELAVSWVYVLIDTVQVLGAAFGVSLLAAYWARRRARVL